MLPYVTRAEIPGLSCFQAPTKNTLICGASGELIFPERVINGIVYYNIHS